MAIFQLQRETIADDFPSYAAAASEEGLFSTEGVSTRVGRNGQWS